MIADYFTLSFVFCLLGLTMFAYFLIYLVFLRKIKCVYIRVPVEDLGIISDVVSTGIQAFYANVKHSRSLNDVNAIKHHADAGLVLSQFFREILHEFRSNNVYEDYEVALPENIDWFTEAEEVFRTMAGYSEGQQRVHNSEGTTS